MSATRRFHVAFDYAEPGRVARFRCEVLGRDVPPPPEDFATRAGFERACPDHVGPSRPRGPGARLVALGAVRFRLLEAGGGNG